MFAHGVPEEKALVQEEIGAQPSSTVIDITNGILDDEPNDLQITPEVIEPIANIDIGRENPDENIVSIDNQTTRAPCILRPFRYLVYLMQIAPASTEGADICMSLYKIRELSPLPS